MTGTKSLSFAVIGLLALASTARADIVFSISDPSQATFTPGTLQYHATFTNTGSEDLFLNADSISLLGNWSGIEVDDSYFFRDVPYPLTAGGAWSGTLFNVAVDSSAAPGTYYGSFYVFGGLDDAAYDQLAAAQDFQVVVNSSDPTPAVPEPSPIVVWGSFMLCGVPVLWRRLRGWVE